MEKLPSFIHRRRSRKEQERSPKMKPLMNVGPGRQASREQPPSALVHSLVNPPLTLDILYNQVLYGQELLNDK